MAAPPKQAGPAAPRARPVRLRKAIAADVASVCRRHRTAPLRDRPAPATGATTSENRSAANRPAGHRPAGDNPVAGPVLGIGILGRIGILRIGRSCPGRIRIGLGSAAYRVERREQGRRGGLRQQMQARARRHGAHQGQRIGDRACTQGRMVQRIDPVAVLLEQLAGMALAPFEHYPRYARIAGTTQTSSNFLEGLAS